MKSPSHRSLLAGFTLAVALIGGVTWLNMDREKRSQDAADWVAHTHKARFVIADLFSGLQEIESGMHGFVLTGMPAFLESYRAAASQIEDDVRLVRNLTSTIPAQQKSLDALEPLIKHRLELAAQVVKARQDQGFDEAQALVVGGQGLAATEAVRAEVGKMDAVEVRLLDEREVINQKKEAAVCRWTVIGACASLALLTLIFGLLLHENRKRQSAQEIEGRLAAIVKSSGDAIIGKDLNGIITTWNEGAEKLFGYTAAEIVGTSILLLIPPGRQQEEQDILERIRSGNSVDHFETLRQTKYGKLLDVSVAASPIKDSKGTVIGVSKVARDISGKKRAEEELSRKNADLEFFTNMVSHDLKSPLVTIKTFLSYLEKDLGDPVARAKDFGYIHGAADKMGRLLDDLLALARVGHLENPSAEVPLQEIVSEAQLLVAGQIAARGVRVEVTSDPVMLHGDRARLVEVFQNLLDNAVKFLSGQPDPRIQIGAEQEGGETVLFVRDNGKGIATGDLTKLFGLFNKLDEHVPGSGIGLAMVRRIVEAHGGKIEAYSDGPGKGTTFRFTLEKTFILPSSPKLCIL